ncbi:PHD finger-like domain-containing 5B [Micractinium conductrix]|uniref:PHD finger-like domain-containing 5B n=1 Tax=Micractinium conductrix TaxID=554055 RepID=A0A2P6V9I6_9CHLO|nr:PHD finger-like domain-containing 5B [Micractinium conductrix]|eukprot:PSC70750.1 PHD finger-like domain-containing 5B [Micractinium conductrix]
MAKHHPDLIMCRKQPGIAIGRLCEKCDGKCVVCDSYVRPATLVRICDECNYGSYAGRCVICGGIGVSDAYYCKECTIQEKDRDGCPKIINLGSAKTDLFYSKKKFGFSKRRALLSSELLTVVVFTIRTDDAVTVVLLLEGASVELAELLKLLGGRLAFYSVRDYEGEVFTATVPAAVSAQSAVGAPAPAPPPAGNTQQVDPAALAELLDPSVLESTSMAAPAPAPAQAPLQSSAAGVPKQQKKNNLGAILGTTASVTLKGGAPKGGAKFEDVALQEVVEATGTPRSARRRQNTVFNSDAN